MSNLASHSTDYAVVEHEPPETMQRNLIVGSHLWSSATVFFFLPFLFAYFYLRSLNQDHLWRPKHVDPSLTLGTLAAAAVVAAAVLLRLGLRDHRADRRHQWRVKGAVALALLVASIVFQIAEWSTQGFGPTEGAYASVYVGWTGVQALFVFALAYWTETTLATSIRYRNARVVGPGEASGDPDRTAHDIHDPISLVRTTVGAVSFYATTVAGIVFVTWVVLYLL